VPPVSITTQKNERKQHSSGMCVLHKYVLYPVSQRVFIAGKLGVLCVKRPLRLTRPFAVILLLVVPLTGLGAYDMCISVVRSYRESGYAATKQQISV
jgi:hypothetical protein